MTACAWHHGRSSCDGGPGVHMAVNTNAEPQTGAAQLASVHLPILKQAVWARTTDNVSIRFRLPVARTLTLGAASTWRLFGGWRRGRCGRSGCRPAGQRTWRRPGGTPVRQGRAYGSGYTDGVLWKGVRQKLWLGAAIAWTMVQEKAMKADPRSCAPAQVTHRRGMHPQNRFPHAHPMPAARTCVSRTCCKLHFCHAGDWNR